MEKNNNRNVITIGCLVVAHLATANCALAADQTNTALGYQALSDFSNGGCNLGFNPTTPGWNTAIGDGALQSTNCTQNTAVGGNALNLSVGPNNTAVGYNSLAGNTIGYDNVAVGGYALSENAGGYQNTAIGYGALLYGSAVQNTAVGAEALSYQNSGGLATGSANSALGFAALSANTSGNDNTAAGSFALTGNTTGVFNTAIGSYALGQNSVGTDNTASGSMALYSNSSGANNTAFGYNALYSNATGKGNAAQGVNALYSNTTGIRNLGIGNNALYTNQTGSYNIALGFDAGYNVTSGSNNIEIGAPGTANDTNTIQIGVQGTQNATTIAGIYGTPIIGSAVYVTATGQLGVLASSERYKTDVQTMGAASNRLQELRPVTFKLKTDPEGPLQYGLIAEEVAKVYPELVIRDASGKIQSVHYEELAPMLLSAVQLQAAEIRDLKRELKKRSDAQDEAIRGLKNLVIARQQQANNQVVAQR